MKMIQTALAPIPAGHYSQAVMANGFVFVAGQLPIIPNIDGRQIPEGITAQAKQVFANLRAILQGAGSDLHDLVSVQIFIPNIEAWGEINAIYEDLLGGHKPARTVIPCGALHYGALIEVNAVAIYHEAK